MFHIILTSYRGIFRLVRWSVHSLYTGWGVRYTGWGVSYPIPSVIPYLSHLILDYIILIKIQCHSWTISYWRYMGEHWMMLSHGVLMFVCKSIMAEGLSGERTAWSDVRGVCTLGCCRFGTYFGPFAFILAGTQKELSTVQPMSKFYSWSTGGPVS